MTMTDPIADMLTRLRNASAAKHETVDMPYSKFKANIAEILKREGYIKDFTAKEAKVGQTLEVTLKYGPNGERSIQGIKRIDVYKRQTSISSRPARNWPLTCSKRVLRST